MKSAFDLLHRLATALATEAIHCRYISVYETKTMDYPSRANRCHLTCHLVGVFKCLLVKLWSRKQWHIKYMINDKIDDEINTRAS